MITSNSHGPPRLHSDGWGLHAHVPTPLIVRCRSGSRNSR